MLARNLKLFAFNYTLLRLVDVEYRRVLSVGTVTLLNDLLFHSGRHRRLPVNLDPVLQWRLLA